MEMLFVIGALLVMTTLLILYNRTGQDQIILFTEKSQLVSAIYEARSRAIQTFAESAAPCGYGIHFENNNTSYILYKNLSDSDTCKSMKNDPNYIPSPGDIYSDGRDQVVRTFTFNQAVKFSPKPVSDILFVPPDPIVYPSGLTITLGTTDGSATETITLSHFGQISI